LSQQTSTVRDLETPSAIRRLEALCDRHEADLAAGLHPLIEERLADSGNALHASLLRELLILEVAYRLRTGERPTIEEYQARFPERVETVAVAFASVDAAADRCEGTLPEGVAFPEFLPSIPGYHVLEELGRGGMGVVYKARPERLNRLVALKMILAGDLAGPEAEAVARLQHPQVVQIFRIGDHRGRPFLEMEFVEGGSLADRLDGTPWPAVEAAKLVESLARAIHHAHVRGIVHRDLKPANILLTSEKLPKVSDFGLAKSLGADEGLTRTNSIIGSPSYMAPEQARGEMKQVGPSTDVYALGAILYELLTGRPPFRAATILGTLEQVKLNEPAAPSQLQPGLPIDVETIVLKCLRKELVSRYANAEELADDLLRFAIGKPVLARPLGPFGRLSKWARRRPLTAAFAIASSASVLLLLLVLVKANYTIRGHQRLTQEALDRERGVRLELAKTNLLLAEQQRLTQLALEQKTVALEQREGDLQREREASYFERIALADSEKRTGRTARVDQLLEACPVDLRNWEWRFLKKAAPPRAFLGHSSEVWDAAISPDGMTVASASFDHSVKTWDLATGALKQTLRGHKERVYSVAFDRGGTRLVSASADKTAIVWDLTTGEPLHTLVGHTDNVRCAAFSPNDYWIATGSWDGTLRLWSGESGKPLGTYRTSTGWITRLAFSPDGRWVVVGGSGGSAEVWNYGSGKRIQRFEEHPGPVLGVAFSPDAQRVATSSNDAGGGVVKIWEVASGREALSFKDPSGIIERVTFSPDGRRLATSGWNGTITLWDTRTGRDVLCLRGHSDRVWGVNFSTNGDSLVSASADGKVLLWEASHPMPKTADDRPVGQ
jgi:WD40 repeat protein/tRNA A-37 threonylcarbamoyl transferase component Bud32